MEIGPRADMSQETPLRKRIRKIHAIEVKDQEEACIVVINKIDGGSLFDIVNDHERKFRRALRKLRSKEAANWLEHVLPSRQKGTEVVSPVAQRVRSLLGGHDFVVKGWNNQLRDQIALEKWTDTIAGRQILCAFSCAVDKVYELNDVASRDRLLEHAAAFVKRTKQKEKYTPAELLRDAHQVPVEKRRDDIEEVEQAIASLMHAYRNPGENLKPNLKKGSEAEKWMLDFLRVNELSIEVRGGGGSFNTGEALAALGFQTHVFWPFHHSLLAGVDLPCTGAEHKNYLQRCWFDDNWEWKSSPFGVPGGEEDGTGSIHPYRVSVPISFTKSSPKMRVAGKELGPRGEGRVIFQIKGFHSDSFFRNDPLAQSGPSDDEWHAWSVLSRWRGQSKRRGVDLLEAGRWKAMQHVNLVKYHRLMLGNFYFPSDNEQQKAELLDILSRQCEGLAVHHEISRSFQNPHAVDNYCFELSRVFQYTGSRTLGMNPGELVSFTSWFGTRVFVAPASPWGESFLQRLVRADQIRKEFHLDWAYVHGDDLDMAAVSPDARPEVYQGLVNAMLFAKIAVYAALTLRASTSTKSAEVTSYFEPTCSPKGILPLYWFARDFAEQFAAGDERTQADMERQILQHGYYIGDRNKKMPGVAAVPVYWPESETAPNVTGAGDITSGIVAALAP